MLLPFNKCGCYEDIFLEMPIQQQAYEINFMKYFLLEALGCHRKLEHIYRIYLDLLSKISLKIFFLFFILAVTKSTHKPQINPIILERLLPL